MSALAMLATPLQAALITLGVKVFSKSSNLSPHQLNSNTNGPVLLFKPAMFRHSCRLLLRIARMEMD